MQDEQFEIGTFAKACGMTKATLMHYEKIGLFQPESVGENGYRYYSENQIYQIETISQLRYLDMSLTDIKDFLYHNTKEENLEILKENLRNVEEKIFRYEHIQRLLQATINTIEAEPYIRLDEPYIEKLAEPVYLYSFPTSKRDGSITKFLPTLREYLQKCRNIHINSNVSIGEIVLHKDIINNTFRKSYGCYQLEYEIDDENCLERPAGFYLSMFHRGNSVDLPDVYRSLKRYAFENGYMIINNAYEEDFSTVISENDRSRFILKVSFQIDSPEGAKDHARK